MGLSLAKHERVWLKNHPELNERWLQDRIAEDPGILGLGDLALLDRERQQERAGRLDLLLAEPEQDRRYEVELQLGATDERHIIRCIEYWDIERRRYPGYEHIAVLVAEDVTSRFLSLLGLFAGSIPLIVIQLTVLKVGDQLVLEPVRVLDQRTLRRDDETEAQAAAVDRSYWQSRVPGPIMSLMDAALEIINEHAEPRQSLNYNKAHIGLTDGIQVRNFIYFRPGKSSLRVVAQAPEPETLVARLEDAGLPANVTRRGKVAFNVSPGPFEEHRELITEILQAAVDAYQS